MSDAEWDQWQKAFQQKAEPLPALSKKARRTQRGVWLANVGFFTIVVGELLAAAGMLTSSGRHAAITHITGLSIGLVMLGMSVGFVRLQRGLWGQLRNTPDEQLAYLEKWIRGSERAAQLARSGSYVCCGMTLVVNVAVWMDEPPPVWLAVGVLAFIAAVFALVWSTPIWNERRLRPMRAQVAQWRQELSEP